MHLALLLVLAAAPSASQTWKFETDGTPQVHIANIDGTVRIDAVDGNTVIFEAVQEGGAGEGNPGRVEVVQQGDEIRARVCCGPCEAQPRTCNKVGPVRFTVSVPRGAELNVSTVNAAVAVTGGTGEQSVSTVNGRVEVNGTEGELSVSSVDGAVHLAPRKVVTTSVSTVSGDVRFRMPDGADAAVEFSSVGGRFNGSPVALGSRQRSFGAGTHEVAVSTVSGELTVQP